MRNSDYRLTPFTAGANLSGNLPTYYDQNFSGTNWTQNVSGSFTCGTSAAAANAALSLRAGCFLNLLMNRT